jgi:hypothetical protein
LWIFSWSIWNWISFGWLYFMLTDNTKGKFHLSNGMRLNFENYILLEDLFPVVWPKNGAELHCKT